MVKCVPKEGIYCDPPPCRSRERQKICWLECGFGGCVYVALSNPCWTSEVGEVLAEGSYQEEEAEGA